MSITLEDNSATIMQYAICKHTINFKYPKEGNFKYRMLETVNQGSPTGTLHFVRTSMTT
jgi:hypothetical protein